MPELASAPASTRGTSDPSARMGAPDDLDDIDVLDEEGAADAALDRNAVHLLGRVSGAPERRALPSGDEVVTLRVVVRRPADGIDTLDVAVGPGPPPGSRRRPGQVGRRLLAQAERLQDGERVWVTGSLRRRWWGSDGQRRQSRVEVRADDLGNAPAGEST